MEALGRLDTAFREAVTAAMEVLAAESDRATLNRPSKLDIADEARSFLLKCGKDPDAVTHLKTGHTRPLSQMPGHQP